MNIEIRGERKAGYEKILTQEAVAFLAKLHSRFNARRLELLHLRTERQAALDSGSLPCFLAETASIRQDPTWMVAEAPEDLQKPYVEITGPVERKMMINALNSGADAFMADFEDALSPTWSNVIEGQINLIDAIDHTLTYTSPEGKFYSLNEKHATLMVRPRGWHLEEKHFIVDNEAISASLFDFGLYFFHNAKRLIAKGTAPYLYLPKLENHLEARLWNDVFLFAQQEIMIPPGTIRATVLIETILAAFEMEEILYELKEHCLGLNAGRWDYIFSIIKKFHKKEFALPDRAQITMTVPFMRAYTNLLIQTCHKRGCHAMGGMAAFVPSRKDAEVNAKARAMVTEDKVRESQDGFDGTWVAHPDLVPVAMDAFTQVLQGRPHQKERLRQELQITEQQLLDFTVPGGTITQEAFRQNIIVSLRYVDAWLDGQGAVQLFNLMEDAATAEIARSQIWQWIHQKSVPFDAALFRAIAAKETHSERAYRIIEECVTKEKFEDFFTLIAYIYLA